MALRSISTPRSKRDLRFLFDEHWSYKVIQGMVHGADYPFRSVPLIPELGIWEPGADHGKKAKDPEIVQWSHANGYVIVTCDNDFRSAEMRQTLLRQSLVEVIWFKKQPSGAQEQLELIARHYPQWVEILGVETPAYRQWMQGFNGRLKKMTR